MSYPNKDEILKVLSEVDFYRFTVEVESIRPEKYLPWIKRYEKIEIGYYTYINDFIILIPHFDILFTGNSLTIFREFDTVKIYILTKDEFEKLRRELEVTFSPSIFLYKEDVRKKIIEDGVRCVISNYKSVDLTLDEILKVFIERLRKEKPTYYSMPFWLEVKCKLNVKIVCKGSYAIVTDENETSIKVHGSVELWFNNLTIRLNDMVIKITPINAVKIVSKRRRSVELLINTPAEITLYYLYVEDLTKEPTKDFFDCYDDFPSFLLDLYPRCGFFVNMSSRMKKIVEKMVMLSDDAYKRDEVDEEMIRKYVTELVKEIASKCKENKVYIFINLYYSVAWVFYHSKVTKLLDFNYLKRRFKMLAKKFLAEDNTLIVFNDKNIHEIMEEIKGFLNDDCFLVENGKIVQEPKYIE